MTKAVTDNNGHNTQDTRRFSKLTHEWDEWVRLQQDQLQGPMTEGAFEGGGGAIFSDKQPTSVFCQKGYKSIYRTNTNVAYRTIMYTYTKIDEKRTIS